MLGLARFFLISALSAQCAGCFFAYCHVPTHAIALVCSEAFAGHFKSAYQHRPQDGVAKRRSNRNINFFQARGFCPERVARPRCDQSWHQFALHVDAFGRPQFRCADSCDRCSGHPSSTLLGGLPLWSADSSTGNLSSRDWNWSELEWRTQPLRFATCVLWAIGTDGLSSSCTWGAFWCFFNSSS